MSASKVEMRFAHRQSPGPCITSSGCDCGGSQVPVMSSQAQLRPVCDRQDRGMKVIDREPAGLAVILRHTWVDGTWFRWTAAVGRC